VAAVARPHVGTEAFSGRICTPPIPVAPPGQLPAWAQAVLSFVRMGTETGTAQPQATRGRDKGSRSRQDNGPPPPVAAHREGSARRLGDIARRHLVPLALFLALAIVMTYPLVRHFGTHLPGDGRDAWQNYWDYWWLRTALAEGRDPYAAPLVYAPYGAPLYLHTLNPFNGLLSLPFQFAFGLTVAYNAVVLLSLTLNAYFASLLAGYVSGSRRAGFVGGVIYAFGSYHTTQLLGHMNLLSSEWLPAYILCLLAASVATGRRRLALIGAGIGALLLLTLCDWQYVLFAGLFTALYAPYAALDRRSFAPLLVAGTIGAGWLALALPLLVPTVHELRDTAGALGAVVGPERLSADLLSFVVPSPLHPWWGSATERLGGLATAPLAERAIFLGFLPLGLAALGCRLGGRRAIFWALAALVFALLALGPTLQIAGRTVGLPLPYRLLQQLPGVNVSRGPARFALLVTLCLAVLAGLGLAGLARRLPRSPTPRLLALATPILVALLLVEHVAVPYPLTAVVPAPFYQQLAAAREAGAVLELPLVMTRATSLYGQTVHGRPIVGGYLSRQLPYPLLTLPPFDDPTDRDIVPPPAAEVGGWGLRLAGVRWIVVLLDDPKLNRREIDAFLARYAEPTPLYRDARMAAYRPLAVGPPTFYLRTDVGWHQPETLVDKRPMRWLPQEATLDAWSLADSAQTGIFRFEAWSFNQPRRLALRVDGQTVGEWLVAEPRQFAVPLTLSPGQHRIELRSLDPPERPARTIGGDDTRLVAIGVTGVELRPLAPATGAAR